MNNTIPIEDLYAASFLLAHGVELKAHERRFGYSTFHFHNDKNTDKLIEQYLTDTSFLKFIDSLRRLKSLIHSDKQGLNTLQSNETNHVQSAKGITLR